MHRNSHYGWLFWNDSTVCSLLRCLKILWLIVLEWFYVLFCDASKQYNLFQTCYFVFLVVLNQNNGEADLAKLYVTLVYWKCFVSQKLLVTDDVVPETYCGTIYILFINFKIMPFMVSAAVIWCIILISMLGNSTKFVHQMSVTHALFIFYVLFYKLTVK